MEATGPTMTSPSVGLPLSSKSTEKVNKNQTQDKLHKIQCYNNMPSKFRQVGKRATVWTSPI
jgi:hypothetical protein